MQGGRGRSAGAQVSDVAGDRGGIANSSTTTDKNTDTTDVDLYANGSANSNQHAAASGDRDGCAECDGDADKRAGKRSVEDREARTVAVVDSDTGGSDCSWIDFVCSGRTEKADD